MTEIALNYSRSLLEGFWGGLKTTLQGIMVGWIIARQTQVNQMIARRIATTEIPYGEALEKLNTDTLNSIHREFNHVKAS